MDDESVHAARRVVRRIDSEETHDLRRRVLRDGTTDAVVGWDGDDDVGTVHLGVVVDGIVVAISTWLSRPAPDDRPGFQLRGMASDPEVAGLGYGSALLQAGLDHARSQDARIVWANARVTALGFYERAGFHIEGPVFVTASTGLPHRLVVFDLDP